MLSGRLGSSPDDNPLGRSQAVGFPGIRAPNLGRKNLKGDRCSLPTYLLSVCLRTYL